MAVRGELREDLRLGLYSQWREERNGAVVDVDGDDSGGSCPQGLVRWRGRRELFTVAL